MNARRELEICAETLQACHAAEEGGADRIELCSALSEGGVTPSHGLLQAALRQGTLPVHVLLRPRGGDFIYSDAEFKAICIDLEHAFSIGAAGIVVGILTPGNTVDVGRMETLIKLASGRPVTFHRAFDQIENLDSAFEDIVALGCSRILTSGGRPTVTEGTRQLTTLAAKANGRIRIAAGGGVTLESAPSLCQIPNLDLHASLRSSAPKGSHVTADPLWQSPARPEVSVANVRMIANMLHAVPNF